MSACFCRTYTKIGTIQRRLAWPLRKDDTQIREAFHIFTGLNPGLRRVVLAMCNGSHDEQRVEPWGRCLPLGWKAEAGREPEAKKKRVSGREEDGAAETREKGPEGRLPNW